MPARSRAWTQIGVLRDHNAIGVDKRNIQGEPHSEHVDAPAGLEQQPFACTETTAAEEPP